MPSCFAPPTLHMHCRTRRMMNGLCGGRYEGPRGASVYRDGTTRARRVGGAWQHLFLPQGVSHTEGSAAMRRGSAVRLVADRPRPAPAGLVARTQGLLKEKARRRLTSSGVVPPLGALAFALIGRPGVGFGRSSRRTAIVLASVSCLMYAAPAFLCGYAFWGE